MKNIGKVTCVLFLLIVFPALSFAKVESRKEAVNPKVSGLMKKAIGLQMPFIKNEGQTDEKVKFYANTFAGTIYITDKGEIVYSLIKTAAKSKESGAERITIKERLESSKESKIEGINKAETKVNYFVGSNKDNWRTNIPTWQEVTFGEVYKGIELKLKAYGKNVEKLFTVHPKGSTKDIKLKIEGAKQLTVNKDGELEVETELGTVKFTKPVAYQEINGKKVDIEAAYEIATSRIIGTRNDNESIIPAKAGIRKNNSELSTPNFKLSYGFQVGAYDRTKPLIIDPVLVYSTYLGGNLIDYGQGIIVDSSGNMYVSGTTSSTNFPTASPRQGSNAGGLDIFVAKINASGTSLIYSTYIGGSMGDSGCGNIAIDSSGNVYLTGYTYSTNFPTVSPLQGSNAGGRDAFVTKINASGSALVYSTYLGGSGFDYPCGWSIAVDSSGNAYVVGETSSTDFPTASPIQGSYGGGNFDAFVAKINPSGSALVYSTYLGGSGFDASWAITVDSSGNAYLSGYTDSTNFPTASPLQGSLAGNKDAFVAKINPSGSALVYSTYLGGSDFEEGYGIAVDSSGNAYVTGKVNSTDFPTVSPLQGSNAGGRDAFVAKINPSGSALVYSTYLGGSGYDVGWGIAVDSSGNAYIAGETESTDFPTVSPIQGSNSGLRDVFVAKINPSGSALVYSTYLGGSGYDEGWDIALDSSRNAYIVGRTTSTNFPTASPIQGSNAGSTDIFVAKMNVNTAAIPLSPSGLISTTTPTFTWSEVIGVTCYQTWDPANGVQTYTNSICSGGTCSTTQPLPQIDGTSANWFVKTCTSGWSSGMAYKVVTATVPSVPTLTSPSGCSSNPITYTWPAVSGATSYGLWSPEINNSIYLSGTICSGGTCTVSGGTIAGGARNWFVRAINYAGSSAWSTGMSYQTIPGTPTGLSPTGVTGVSTTTSFTWDDKNAASYYIWLGDTSGEKLYKQVTSASCNGTTCTTTGPITPLSGSTYHTWFVKSFAPGCSTSWSARGTFTTEP